LGGIVVVVVVAAASHSLMQSHSPVTILSNLSTLLGLEALGEAAADGDNGSRGLNGGFSARDDDRTHVSGGKGGSAGAVGISHEMAFRGTSPLLGLVPVTLVGSCSFPSSNAAILTPTHENKKP